MRNLLILILLFFPSLVGAAIFVPVAAGGNWAVTNTWGVTSTPTASDSVTFAAGSGPVTINTGTCLCKSLVTDSGATNITFTSGQILIVSGGVTIGSGMTIIGAGSLVLNAAATLLSNTKTFTGNLIFNAANTYTLSDTWTVSGSVTVATGAATVNGGTLNVGANLYCNGAPSYGTVTYVLNGSGVWGSNAQSATSAFYNNVTINTSGSITLGAYISYGTGIITYTNAVTVNAVSNNNTLYVSCNLNFTLNTNGMRFQNMYIPCNSSITLSSNAYFAGVVRNLSSIGTFVGTNNLTVDTLTSSGTAGSPGAYIFPANQSVTVLSKLLQTGIDTGSLGLSPRNYIKSGTGGQTTSLVYIGTIANESVMGVNFTDVNASSSSVPILDYVTLSAPATLSNTTNITKVNLPYPPNAWGGW